MPSTVLEPSTPTVPKSGNPVVDNVIDMQPDATIEAKPEPVAPAPTFEYKPSEEVPAGSTQEPENDTVTIKVDIPDDPVEPAKTEWVPSKEEKKSDGFKVPLDAVKEEEEPEEPKPEDALPPVKEEKPEEPVEEVVPAEPKEEKPDNIQVIKPD